jgi:DNA-binding transcriptional MocR family regulator
MEPREAAEKLREHAAMLKRFGDQVSQNTTNCAEAEAYAHYLAHVLRMFGEFKDSQARLIEMLEQVAYFRLEIFSTPSGDAGVQLEKALPPRKSAFSDPPFEPEFFNSRD